jgi:hypothetical protein
MAFPVAGIPYTVRDAAVPASFKSNTSSMRRHLQVDALSRRLLSVTAKLEEERRRAQELEETAASLQAELSVAQSISFTHEVIDDLMLRSIRGSDGNKRRPTAYWGRQRIGADSVLGDTGIRTVFCIPYCNSVTGVLLHYNISIPHRTTVTGFINTKQLLTSCIP